MNARIFQISKSHLKNLGASRGARSMFHTEDPQIIGDNVKSLVAMAIWSPRIVHPWNEVF